MSHLKLVMTMLVRDDEDILGANLRYHFAQGVDLAIVTDHGSVDGSREVLEEYRREGHLVLLEETGDTYYSALWRTRMAQMAASDFDADWVITPDPDEFMWPASGTLHEVFSAIPPEFSMLVTPRPEFVPATDDEGFFADHMVIRESTAARGPKVAHRGLANIQVSTGNHWAVADDSPMTVKRAYSNLAEVPYWPVRTFHFRFRGYAHFERSVRMRIATKLEGHGDGSLLKYEKHILSEDVAAAYREDRLAEFYRAKFVIHPDRIASGLQDGSLVVDRRFQQFFADDAANSGSPTDPPRGMPRAANNSASLPYLGWTADEAAEIQHEMGADLNHRFWRLELSRVRVERQLAAIERSPWWRVRQALFAIARSLMRR